MVPERSGRLLSPTGSTYSSGRVEPHGGASDAGAGEAGAGKGGISGAISGKIKWWLDRGGGNAPVDQGVAVSIRFIYLCSFMRAVFCCCAMCRCVCVRVFVVAPRPALFVRDFLFWRGG